MSDKPIKIYYGYSHGDKTTADDVTVRFIEDIDGTSQDLPLCLDVYSHSPTGFSWGYNGSGPAQLALAIMVTMIGKQDALKVYQVFKDSFVSRWRPGAAWSISSVEIEEWLNDVSAVYLNG